jgi:hypothetical protein
MKNNTWILTCAFVLGAFSLVFSQNFKASAANFFIESDIKNGYFFPAHEASGTVSVGDAIHLSTTDGVFKGKILKIIERYRDEYYNDKQREVQKLTLSNGKVDLVVATEMPASGDKAVITSTDVAAVAVEKPKVNIQVTGTVNGMNLEQGTTNYNGIYPPNNVFKNTTDHLYTVFYFDLPNVSSNRFQIVIFGKFDGKTGAIADLEVLATGTTQKGKQPTNFGNGTKDKPTNFAVNITKAEKGVNDSWTVSGNFSGLLKPIFKTKLLANQYDMNDLNFNGKFENVVARRYTEAEMRQMNNVFNQQTQGFKN